MVDLAGARWFKSSRSGGSKNCVEVAFLDDSLVGVRDSKNIAGPALIFTGRSGRRSPRPQPGVTSTSDSAVARAEVWWCLQSGRAVNSAAL
ncbi:DUF397 domain-containing protein [Nocardia africana]|uniref:Domain of uncharacterized function (DUF397) n=1 Tax=Nocardia africana TaxID=134964 RepID=A0A378WM32_9NOCA|nr:DUF397 domain-containing protein [Nocardia africana]SUA41982.1 Domain of uncharacterised function (DUF397) [Nocardia africana]